MKKIHITGNAGAGKTYLASLLSQSTGIHAYSLDAIVWQPGWKKTSPEERNRLEQELISKPSWIIEGVSKKVQEAADTIVFIDVPILIALWRCAKRNYKYLFSSRPGLPENCPEIKIIPRLLKIIFQFPKQVRPSILQNFNRWKGQKQFIHIQNQNDLDKLIRKIVTKST